MPTQTALLGIVPPVLISLAVLLFAWRPWRAAARVTRLGIAGSALALALAYAATDTLITHSSPGFPPAELHRWLPWIAAVAAAAVIAFPPAGAFRISPHDLVGLASFILMRWEYLQSKTTIIGGAIWVVMCTILGGAIRTDAVRVGACGPRVPLVWMVACIGASITFVQGPFNQLAQLAGCIAAVMGVFAVLGFWRRTLEFVPGMAPVFATLFVCMTQAAGAQATVESKVLLMLAAVCPALAGTPMLARAPRWVGTVLSMLLAAGLSVASVWMSPHGFDFSGY